MSKCIGNTTCAVSVNTSGFRSHYTNYPVQNLCENEPVACYHAFLNGNVCYTDDTLVQPDCGGGRGAAALLYNCHINSIGMPFDMPGSPGMDCEQLWLETGHCFEQDGAGEGIPFAGQCQWLPGPTPPPQKPGSIR